ncbi:glutaminyl-peptide cyclotransferase [Streptomyces sp. NPDC001549]|uniref:glutaminyl-peptide cyclotransferase n=1 Tax=Streptomyces sp. NPDC001549 TaxID=3364586 RepID=UPI00367C4266
MWQLTWRDRTAIERDAKTLAELRRVPYPDDGWGVRLQRDRHRPTATPAPRLCVPGTRACAAWPLTGLFR